MKAAILELEHKRETFNHVSEEFQGVAYYELKAAEERMLSIRREAMKSERSNI